MPTSYLAMRILGQYISVNIFLSKSTIDFHYCDMDDNELSIAVVKTGNISRIVRRYRPSHFNFVVNCAHYVLMAMCCQLHASFLDILLILCLNVPPKPIQLEGSQ